VSSTKVIASVTDYIPGRISSKTLKQLPLHAVKMYHILDILKDTFKTTTKIHACNVLEIGCGTGVDSRNLCEFFKTYLAMDCKKNIDLAKENTHALYSNLTFIVDDIVETALPARKKQIILSLNTIHLVSDIDAAIKNIIKLLVKNGICLIVEPLIKPVDWLDERLNSTSPAFNNDLWLIKEKALRDEFNYLVNLPPRYKVNVEYIECDNFAIYKLNT